MIEQEREKELTHFLDLLDDLMALPYHCSQSSVKETLCVEGNRLTLCITLSLSLARKGARKNISSPPLDLPTECIAHFHHLQHLPTQDVRV